jgi:hypothetical protein
MRPSTCSVGRRKQATAADAADGLARMVAGVQLDPAVLGTVRSAAAFAQAIGVASARRPEVLPARPDGG